MWLYVSVQICTQMAVLVAKIARLDCPRFWPNLLPTLLQTVRCENPLLQERCLLVLHHVIKTLASKRLAADRKLFEDVSLTCMLPLITVLSVRLLLFFSTKRTQKWGFVVTLALQCTCLVNVCNTKTWLLVLTTTTTTKRTSVTICCSVCLFLILHWEIKLSPFLCHLC